MKVDKCLAAVNIWKRGIIVCAVVLAMAASMFSQTAQRANRITEELNAGGMVRMAGTVHPLTRRATDLGAAEPGMRLESLTLSTLPGAAEQKELNGLLAAQQNRKSPLFHHWLTQEEYGARFGLTDSDLGKLTGWLASQGFEVKSVAPSRTLITFSGTVGQVQAAFQTQIHQYRLEGETRISNASEIAIPRSLAGVVARVGGLSGFRPKAQAKRAAPQFTLSDSGTHFLTPADWATIYDVNPIYLAGFTGTGMHVGVVGQTYIPQGDVDAFRAAAGLGPTLLNYVCISPSNCATAAGESILDMPEADLDVEWAGGIAQNATVDYIYTSATDTTQGALDALVHGITTYLSQSSGSRVPVLSMSYGFCESDINDDQAYKLELDSALAEAQAQGQTVLIASGDDGAGCTTSTLNFVEVASNGAVINWPASSPYVTAVGGTRFSGDGTDTYGDQYWTGSTGMDILDSAQKYIPEKAWDDTAADQAANPLALFTASGGGVSVLYDPPGWQPTPTNYIGTSIMRFVPDVSFTASADHDGYLICTPEFPASATSGSQTSGASCLNDTFRDVDGQVTPMGGTSASTASFAGVVALLVQKYGPLGNLSPALYGLANNGTLYGQVFHDVTTGNNNVPCDTVANGCLNGTVGYNATTGYDLATGLGSIDANALFTAYVSALAPTVTTVTATPNSLAMGAGTNLTATVASGTSGTISGTVTFLVNNLVVGTVTNLVPASGANSVAATATLGVVLNTVNGFVEGSNIITVSYSGSGTYAASSGSTTVAALTTPTTTKITVSNPTIALGDASARETFTATVSSGSGSAPSGWVQFLVDGHVPNNNTDPQCPGAICQLFSGVATFQNTPPTSTNGFVLGSNTVTATYIPDIGVSSGISSGTAPVMVTAPAYTITPASASVTLNSGQSQNIVVTLDSTTFADAVALTLLPSSAAITASLSSSTVNLAASGHTYVSLTISATNVAANRPPMLPGTGGLIAFGAVLAGVPLMQRRKRVAAVLLTALAVSALLFTMSCGSKASRNYTVQIMGSGGVSTVVNVIVK
jgi:hypothetical protein